MRPLDRFTKTLLPEFKPFETLLDLQAEADTAPERRPEDLVEPLIDMLILLLSRGIYYRYQDEEAAFVDGAQLLAQLASVFFRTFPEVLAARKTEAARRALYKSVVDCLAILSELLDIFPEAR